MDAAVDLLINDVKGILEKPVLAADDAVIADGRVEISYTVEKSSIFVLYC